MVFVNRFRVLAVLAVALVAVVSGCGALPGGTQVSDLETRNAQLQGTIDGLGTPAATIAALAMTADRGMLMQAELSNLQGTALAVQSTLTVQQFGGSSARPTPAPGGSSGEQVTTSQTTPMTPDGGGGSASDATGGTGTEFYETTMALARDSFDCPLNPTTTFDASDTVIYAIVRASNLSAGSTISARWYANGVLYDEGECWTPNTDWDDVCAYCDLQPQEGVFEAGSWSVEMLLNGEQLSQATFEVIGSDFGGTTGDTSGDTTGDTTGDLGGDAAGTATDGTTGDETLGS